MSINVSFCREELKAVITDVKKHLQHTQTHYTSTPEGSIKAAWVYKVGKDHWEFHFGPFYWHGSADNAYDARSKGWTSWLRSQGADGYVR
jgi:hypothetical protein